MLHYNLYGMQISRSDGTSWYLIFIGSGKGRARIPRLPKFIILPNTIAS